MMIDSYIFIHITFYSSCFPHRHHTDKILTEELSKQWCNGKYSLFRTQIFNYIHLFGVHIHATVCVCVEARWQTLEEDSRYHLGSKCQSHVVRLGGKCLYLLSHLTGS